LYINKHKNLEKVPKRLSLKEKEEMVESFRKGISLEDLSIEYKLKKLTISKHLKNKLGNNEFKRIQENLKNKVNDDYKVNNSFDENNFIDTFYELVPTNDNFEDEIRKDCTSEKLTDKSLPDNIHMFVDMNTELKINLISDFPEFSFLSDADQRRKVIRLFSEKKEAKNFASKNQKVMKVPNGKIFMKVSHFLIKKGISRIFFDNKLFSI
tara:strand:+ start:209 stop:838 length:630 start_codon:yes stop_codon:yes gene_type:complete